MPSKETSKNSPTDKKPFRLQRFLAQAGLGSRRKCEELILEGRVEIDGRVVEKLGTTVSPSQQTVRVDGERIKTERKVYLILNKPCGYLCTHNDPSGRARVIDLLPDGPRLFTVGRLDENSQGLLLATNDGELANRLAHPRFQVERRYQVQVAGQPTRETLYELKKGLNFADGYFSVRGIKRLKIQGKSSFLELSLTEGQNREIRRLFARVGHKVMKLKRVGFGPLRLGKLPEGQHRILKDTELKALKELLKSESNPDQPKQNRSRSPQKKQTTRSQTTRSQSTRSQTTRSQTTKPQTAKPQTRSRTAARAKTARTETDSIEITHTTKRRNPAPKPAPPKTTGKKTTPRKTTGKKTASRKTTSAKSTAAPKRTTKKKSTTRTATTTKRSAAPPTKRSSSKRPTAKRPTTKRPSNTKRSTRKRS